MEAFKIAVQKKSFFESDQILIVNINRCSFLLVVFSGEQGWRSGESAHLPPMCPGFDSQTRRHMWVEFVVGSLPCFMWFFSGYFGFPLSSETNISKLQFDLDFCQTLYREPLARVMESLALPVVDIKFAFTFTNSEYSSVCFAVLVTSVTMKSFIFNCLLC